MMRRENALAWGDVVWVSANTIGVVPSESMKETFCVKRGGLGVFFQEMGDRSIVMFDNATLSVKTESVRLTSVI